MRRLRPLAKAEPPLPFPDDAGAEKNFDHSRLCRGLFDLGLDLPRHPLRHPVDSAFLDGGDKISYLWRDHVCDRASCRRAET